MGEVHSCITEIRPRVVRDAAGDILGTQLFNPSGKRHRAAIRHRAAGDNLCQFLTLVFDASGRVQGDRFQLDCTCPRGLPEMQNDVEWLLEVLSEPISKPV